LPPSLNLQKAPDDVLPLCPHCKKELTFLWVKEKGVGLIEKQKFLLCPHCRALLGYGSINFI
jgi:uncharacterized protein with PIN domain